ncbi:hypothetical protein AB0M54_22640 [Actinoplanes sp. NPDC051470]|uniref:hypothetical protein n=1 Tax=Actinoplanes sp. NPDC051470 TaxID=3157224 RepID=UPI00343436E5
MVKTRFVDEGRWLNAFAGEFLVACPRCAAVASVRRDWDDERRRWCPASVVCPGCGFARREPAEWAGPVCVRARCRCGGFSRPLRAGQHLPAAPRARTMNVTCDDCGHVTTAAVTVHSRGVPGALVDSCFGLPLALRTPCAGLTLWAFNAAHLAYLKSFLGADLRERQSGAYSRSVVARLPGRLKQAKHRDEALRAIRRLEGVVLGAGGRGNRLALG